MSTTYNIYCDESCHLENDGQSAMVLGAIWCAKVQAHNVAAEIRAIKTKHKLPPDFEVKWTKVSPGKVDFYLDIVTYFFSNNALKFRALVIPDKSKLRHEQFNQLHDDFYYKMYFNLLKAILKCDEEYCVYLDYKDTRSGHKSKRLRKVLSNNMLDFRQTIIKHIQTVRSHEVEQIQLADLLIGALSYINRGFESSTAKKAIVDKIKALSGHRLTHSTNLKESKFNIFIWHAKEDSDG